MKNIATAARRCHVLASCVLRQRAVQHGWATVDSSPTGLPYCAVLLQLGSQRIPVHLVLPGLASDALLLEAVTGGAMSRDYPEQVIVLMDCPGDDVRRYRALFDAVQVGRITVGTIDDYCAWLPRRLGIVGQLALDTPLRQLAEHLLSGHHTAEPTKKRPPSRTKQGSDIDASFALGRDGVQCAETLFAHVVTGADVTNLEEDTRVQAQGFDLLVDGIRTEIKTEAFTTGYIALETHSCFCAKIPYRQIKEQTPGWLMTSRAQILGTILWKTGDMLLADFEKVKEWVLGRRPQFDLRLGTVKKQRYHSQFYRTPIKELLTEVPASLHLNLGDWMPKVYGAQFKMRSLVEGAASTKTLQLPHRLG